MVGEKAMQSVLVTGGNGFLGSHICQSLVERGYDVSSIDIAPYKWRDEFADFVESGRLRLLEGDIADERFVFSVIDRARPEIVIHLASVVGVGRYIQDPMRVIEINLFGLRNILRSIKGSGARIVFASTSEVYGKNPEVPWIEESDRVLGPTGVSRWSYSTSKAAAEHMIWACSGPYGLDAVVVRYFNLYGPRQKPELLVPAQILRALTGGELLVYDGGNQTRCFTYVDDAVSGTCAAAFSPHAPGLTFNIGSPVETSVLQVSRMIGEMSGNGGYIIREVSSGEIYGDAYEDIPRRVPDTRRVAGVLGWEASTPLREGLLKTIQWWRDQIDGAGPLTY
ncbi:MAG: NAD-dependent epimerase/dehydratase family protein [Firmicutes bacterium]|nr:NAD-dependent epimerase/dehydratase family protein [Bacillota bacterium]